MTERSRIDSRRAALVVGVIVVTVVVAALAVRGGSPGAGQPGASAGSGTATGTGAPPATPVPPPGLEVYGFVPYWEMDATIAGHLAGTDLSTLALFSVTNRRNGSIDTSQRGYKTITGPLGRQMIQEAHGRGVRVEIVFTSFGSAKNKQLFGASSPSRAGVVPALVDLVGQVGADGVNVDVEGLPLDLVAAYGAFVGELRTALRAAHPNGQVSVATQANESGAALAVAADAAGADRIFLMGYDYHTAGSQPGASAPMDRRDGSVKDLVWSLDLYAALGVPVEKTILGLPLYGISWPVTGPEVGAAATGKGTIWIPGDHLDVLHDPAVVPVLDEIEQVEVYTLPVPGSGATRPGGSGQGAASLTTGAASPATAAAGPTTVGASPSGWQVIYVDSPATLTPKLALANARGLAGVGFWAIGYERGAPEYSDLIARFRSGKLN